MKQQIGNEPYIFRPTGLPIEGRLFVFKLNTDIPATTYTLEGTAFVQAANPVLLHSGLPDDSLFVDVGLYTIAIEQYIGPEGQMSVDSPDEYFRRVDQYEVGLDFDPQASSANVVDTLDDLQDASTELKTVTVLWHDTPGDCVPRTYYWDATAQDQIDGGYVVGSNVSDTGRWILLWGDEILPCSIYGVIPGRESNLNLLLNYPATVGSFALKTAPCVRFIPGDYTTNVNFVTDKELVFDNGARFVSAEFTCPRIRVMGGTPVSYVGEFTFTAPDAVAHSSWFRTLYGFWTCGAKFLEMDSTNFFADSVIHGNVSLAGKVVSGTGRIPCTYESGRYFLVGANTTINGRIFNSAVDYVRIMTDGWGDAIFARTGTWDPGLISAGHHVQYDAVPDLDLFESADRWVKTMVERRARISAQVWSDFTLDLQNRRLDNINIGTFTEIRNGTFNRLTVAGTSTSDITFRNVTASDVTFTGRYLTVYDSNINFGGVPLLRAIWGHDSRIASSMIWTDPSVQCEFERCYIGMSFHRVTENVNTESLLKFMECTFQRNVGIYTKNLEMYRCLTDNNAIKIYPYKNTSDNAYHFRVVLEGNNFNTAYPIEFTRVEVINGWVQEDVYDIILNWRIIGNTFAGNDEGIRMRYWQKRAGSYYTRTFIKMANGVHSIEYSGNIGKCPSDNMRGVSISDNKGYVEEEIAGGSKVYKYQSASRRCMMSPNSTWWSTGPISGPNTLMKYYSWVNSPYNSLTYSMFVQAAWFSYPRAHDEVIEDGDFFLLAILIFGDYLRIVQRGDGDRNDGVIGKVI